MDRNRRFFVSNVGGLKEGEEIFRQRYRNVSDDPEAPAEKVAIQVKQPLAIEMFYEGAGLIDQHNKMRAAELRIDRGLKTKDWSKRANFGVFGICTVDAYYLRQGVVHPDNRDGDPDIYFSKLADEMIDNTIGVRPSRRSQGGADRDSNPLEEIRLRQTIRTKPKSTDKNGRAKMAQGICQIKGCSKQSTYVCNACTHPTDAQQKQHWFCDPLKSPMCFASHKRIVHNIGAYNNDNEDNNDNEFRVITFFT